MSWSIFVKHVALFSSFQWITVLLQYSLTISAENESKSDKEVYLLFSFLLPLKPQKTRIRNEIIKENVLWLIFLMSHFEFHFFWKLSQGVIVEAQCERVAPGELLSQESIFSSSPLPTPPPLTLHPSLQRIVINLSNSVLTMTRSLSHCLRGSKIVRFLVAIQQNLPRWRPPKTCMLLVSTAVLKINFLSISSSVVSLTSSRQNNNLTKDFISIFSQHFPTSSTPFAWWFWNDSICVNQGQPKSKARHLRFFVGHIFLSPEEFIMSRALFTWWFWNGVNQKAKLDTLSKIVRFVVPKTYIQVFCSCFENRLVNICFKQGQPKSEVIHFFGSHFSQPRGIHHLLLVCLHQGDTYVTESWNLIHISVSKNQNSMLLHLGLTISYYLLFVD